MNTNTIHIPVDGKEQDQQINENYGIANVKGWELAARIYARCAPRQGQRSDKTTSNKEFEVRLSFAELSRRVGGKRTSQNIGTHWGNWQAAVDKRLAIAVSPGDTVQLPDEDYPPTGHGGGLEVRSDTSPEKQESVALEIMRRNPDIAKAVVSAAIAESPEVSKSVEEAFVRKASRDPVLKAKVDAAYSEMHVIPNISVKHSAQTLGGFHAGVYLAMQREARGLQELVEALGRESDADSARVIAEEEIEGLDEVIVLIRQMQDQIRLAIGVNYDANFSRLMGRG